jgi:hypothetical protein
MHSCRVPGEGLVPSSQGNVLMDFAPLQVLPLVRLQPPLSYTFRVSLLKQRIHRT